MQGWTGQVLLSPGDTIYFRNTDTWSGNPNNWVPFLQLKGGCAYNGNSWGTGKRATISGTSSVDDTFLVSMWMDNPTYETVFDGFTIDADNKVSPILVGTDADLTGATKRIQNCVVDCSGQNDVDSTVILISCDGGHTVSNVEIINNIAYGGQEDGIYAYPHTGSTAENILISNNECYGNGISSLSSGSGVKLKNHVVNATIEYNYIHNNDGSGIALDTSADERSGPENCTLRYNLVMNGNYSSKWNSAISITTNNPGGATISADIYSNILWNPYFTSGINIDSRGNPAVTLRIYNNIIYCKGPAIDNGQNNGLIDLRNNILISSSGSGSVLIDRYNVVRTHASNIYHRDTGLTLVSINNGGSTYTSSTLSSWEPSAYSSDPNFKNQGSLPTGFINNIPNTDGLSILSGNAIGHGTNLGSPFNYSINGVLRGPMWDIGAYQTS